MIRNAGVQDIAAIVGMAGALARATAMPVDVDPVWTGAFVARLLASEDGFARVVDRGAGPIGMLVATVGHIPVSPVRVASECGWWCGPEARGWGLRLLNDYVAWARARGCAFARMSTAAAVADGDAAAKILTRTGWQRAEQAWVMGL